MGCEDDAIPAGAFSAWLHETVSALEHDAPTDVPCGTCTGCCRSSYFIHVGPDETDTLRRIPKELLFPAPGLPKGHVVVGYDEEGRCPMLRDDGCSIYEDRPRTCRSYDCRVFAAADIYPDEDGKSAVGARARRWRFEHPNPEDERQHAATKAAAVFIRARPIEFADIGAANTSRVALLALVARTAFEGGHEPDVDTVRRALRGGSRRPRSPAP